MKKIFLTIISVVILSFVVTAQHDGFFSDYRDIDRIDENIDLPQTPGSHGLNENFDAPVGNGILILSILGVGYALRKRKASI